jgi:hypothetical protein
MKEYKRFTQWTENGASLKLDNPQNNEEARKQLMEKFKLACNFLAELEDKIENGTLIELPFIQKGQYNKRWYVYYRKKTGNKNITWKMFYSKAEAQAKLKELQNESK